MAFGDLLVVQIILWKKSPNKKIQDQFLNPDPLNDFKNVKSVQNTYGWCLDMIRNNFLDFPCYITVSRPVFHI